MGSEVIRQFQSENFEYASPRSSELDIRDEHQLESYILDFRPNWIINCAAWTDVEGAEDFFEDALVLNEIAVKKIAELASKFDSRVIHISTDYVFDGTSSTPYLENSPVNPINKYGESKLLGELALLKALPTTSYILRTSWLYGRNGKNFVKTIAKKALHSEAARVVDDQEGSPTSARDLAQGIISLIKVQPPNGIYHFSNIGSCSWFELARAIYQKVGADPTLIEPVHSSTLNMRAERPQYSLLSKEKWKSAGLLEIADWKSSLRALIPEILTEIHESEK